MQDDVENRRGDARREQILAAAIDEIVLRGVSGVTYRTVAAAAGMPLGSMTYYFSSKDELLFHAFESFANQAFDRMAAAARRPPQEGVEQLVDLVMTEADELPRDRLLLAELYVLSYRDARYADLTREWMARARQAISTLAGPERARAVDAVQEGLTLQRYFLPSEVTEDMIRSTLNAVLRAD